MNISEARRLVALDDCRNHGHNFDVAVEFGSGEPTSVMCQRCGQAWLIKQAVKP